MRGVNHRSGFTLIEVLVVVAIIALLVAILLPSLTRAREQARTSVCMSNMKQALTALYLEKTEKQMRNEEWSTNFGWAVHALKQLKGQTEVFTCPNEEEPRPTAAVLDRLFDGDRLSGITSGDGVFSRVIRQGGDWVTDIQDQTDMRTVGGTDAYDDSEGDLLIQYTPRAQGQRTVTATIQKGAASWRHDVIDYRGKMIVQNVSGAVEANIPLLWLSYGANASAGLKGVRGNPLLIGEADKNGIFPEKLGAYPSDHLGWVLRFNHGGKVTNQPELRGADWSGGSLGSRPPKTGNRLNGDWIDGTYQPNQRMNAGFVDGHVETLSYWEVMDLNELTPTSRPMPKHSVWFGHRPASSVEFD